MNFLPSFRTRNPRTRSFIALNKMACAESVTEAEAFTPPAVSKNPYVMGANALLLSGMGINDELSSIVPNANMVFFLNNSYALPSYPVAIATGTGD